MTDEEKKACAYLPDRLAEAIIHTVSLWNKPFSEVRLRLDGPLSVTLCSRGKNLLCGVSCTQSELKKTVELLCAGSLYSHSESIREGVIVTDCGIRAGVAGRAVVIDGKIECVRDISSVSIRIPHRVPGAADELYEIVRRYGSTLICSPPGMGKTTMLRELIPLLSKGEDCSKAAVIDTRCELGAGMERDMLCDFYIGWPRYEGICAAVRTMSPDYIICDEIAQEDDIAAVCIASAAGVKMVASAHGDSLEGVCRSPHLKKLIDEGIFSCVCGIEQSGEGRSISVWEAV